VSDEGITLFDGLFQILKTVKEPDGGYFEYLMFSNIQNVIAELGDITIGDLDWSEYNHSLDKDIIRDSWENSVEVNGVTTSNFTSGVPDGFGYIYSWFDLGFEYPFSGSARQQRTNQLTVGVYLREVLEKMMSFVGQEYEFTLNNIERFKRMVLFNEGGDTTKLLQAELDAREVDKDDAINVTGNAIIDNNICYIGVQRNLSQYFDTANIDGLNQVQNGVIKIARRGLYNIDLIGKYYLSITSNDPIRFPLFTSANSVRFYLTKNGNIIAPSSEVGESAFPLAVASTKQEIEYELNFSGEYFFEAGDEIDFRVSAVVQRPVNLPQANTTLSIFIESDTEVQNTILTAIEGDLQDGSDIVISRFMPNLKCSDFYKSLMRMMNLYQLDTDDGVKIIPAIDFYGGTNAAQTDDWSELLDYSNTIEIEPPNRIEGKFYSFAFGEEKDFYNNLYFEEWGVGYGNKLFEVANTWQQGTNELKLSFAQSVPVQIDGTNVIMPAIYKEENGVVSPYKGKHARVFIYNGLIDVPQPEACSLHPSNGDWGFAPDNEPLFIGDEIAGTWSYPQFHHSLNVAAPTFDMVFELPRRLYFDFTNVTNNNLWTQYWERFILELTSADSKILTAYFKLSKLDIKNLDFSRLKNIDGVVYRLNIVSDYMADEELTVMCELIRVIKGDSFVSGLLPVDPTLPVTEPAIVGDNGGGTGVPIINGGIKQERYSLIYYG
jgi:hypothetical protein